MIQPNLTREIAGPAPSPSVQSSREGLSIVIKGLSKVYGDVVALRPIDLQVKNGEFLTLLGPSGSGKTTLLQLIAGLISPTSGSLEIRGIVATDLHPSKRDIGMVFQNYALFPHLSVFENIAFPLRMRRQSEAHVQREVRRALEMVHLPQVYSRYPKELSGGQQQRIALARCLVYRPSVILMDEPLGALDKKLREHMQLEIKRIHRDIGTTILYVTHDQEEALSMSDRICLMRDGGIAQDGAPKDLYFEPNSAFVADFMGQPNLVDGTVAAVDGEAATLITADGEMRGLKRGNLLAGEAAQLLVRPEMVRVVAPGRTSETSVRAHVIDVSQIGALTKATFETQSRTTLVGTFLSAADDRGIYVGAELLLGWNTADARILRVG